MSISRHVKMFTINTLDLDYYINELKFMMLRENRKILLVFKHNGNISRVGFMNYYFVYVNIDVVVMKMAIIYLLDNFINDNDKTE